MNSTTLILDGIWGRPRRFEGLRERIEASVGPAEIYRYDASGRAPFETLGRRLAERVEAIGTPINCVAMSMGGLVVRAARLVEPALPLQRCVFLNSPHAGSRWAHLVPLAAVRQMRPGSPFLRQLEAAPWDVETLCVWTRGDAMILPNASANWAKATQTIRCRVPAHNWAVWSRGINNSVIEFLR